MQELIFPNIGTVLYRVTRRRSTKVRGRYTTFIRREVMSDALMPVVARDMGKKLFMKREEAQRAMKEMAQ